MYSEFFSYSCVPVCRVSEKQLSRATHLPPIHLVYDFFASVDYDNFSIFRKYEVTILPFLQFLPFSFERQLFSMK